MSQTLRNIIFWSVLTLSIAVMVFGVMQGDVMEGRMESSAL